MLVALIFTSVLLAYANGANDNFKGVATLFGSGTSDYPRALKWACLTTLAGSLTAVWLSTRLASVFSGKGLVSDNIAAAPEFLVPVGLGAAVTIQLATFVGLPVSTTHALTGALVGTALVRAGGEIDFHHLGSAFFAPLAFSPLLALAVSAAAYILFRWWRLRLGIDKESCLCVGQKVVRSELVPVSAEQLFKVTPLLEAKFGSSQHCQQRYRGNIWGVRISTMMDSLHYLSAGAVGFARGLNDTPKIAALLVAGSALAPWTRYGVIALFIALGGWLSARRVAETVSQKITSMNPGQGFSANLVTSFLVIVASRLGLPVSTTHVSVGSIFGIGVLTRSANKRMIGTILLSWVGTLPVAAVSAGLLAWVWVR